MQSKYRYWIMVDGKFTKAFVKWQAALKYAHFIAETYAPLNVAVVDQQGERSTITYK